MEISGFILVGEPHMGHWLLNFFSKAWICSFILFLLSRRLLFTSVVWSGRATRVLPFRMGSWVKSWVRQGVRA